MTEQWLPYPDNPCYEISSFGRVRSLPRKVGAPGGGSRILLGKLMTVSEYGYVKLAPLDRDKAKREIRVAREVLMLFGPPPPSEKAAPVHLDGDRRNCRLDNLRWADW